VPHRWVPVQAATPGPARVFRMHDNSSPNDVPVCPVKGHEVLPGGGVCVPLRVRTDRGAIASFVRLRLAACHYVTGVSCTTPARGECISRVGTRRGVADCGAWCGLAASARTVVAAVRVIDAFLPKGSRQSRRDFSREGSRCHRHRSAALETPPPRPLSSDRRPRRGVNADSAETAPPVSGLPRRRPAGSSAGARGPAPGRRFAVRTRRTG
jgi:hypothetical protein